MEEYEKLKRLVDGIAEDVLKAIGGNKAAGTRVRKVMQDIRNTAQAVRTRILDLRKSEESGDSNTGTGPAGAGMGGA